MLTSNISFKIPLVLPSLVIEAREIACGIIGYEAQSNQNKGWRHPQRYAKLLLQDFFSLVNLNIVSTVFPLTPSNNDGWVS